MARSSWATKADYPYHSYICDYAMVAFGEHFIVFGGYGSYSSYKSTIAKFTPRLNKWTKLGSLRSPRYSHGVVGVNNHFVVVGGGDIHPTESCTLNGDKMRCTGRLPSLKYFTWYPELFAVSVSYTDKCKKTT